MRAPAPPPLATGQRLDAAAFLRRWEAEPSLKMAELIDGRVRVTRLVPCRTHGGPNADLTAWLGVYSAQTPDAEGSVHPTLRLDARSVPQPDACLRLARGGGTRVDADDLLCGPPELVAEVAFTTRCPELHDKLDTYRARGVREYLVWRTEDAAVDWFALRGAGDDATYEPLPVGGDGVIRSEVFPGLRLDPAALLRRDLAGVLARLNDGLASGEHAAFAAGLAARLAGERDAI